MRLPQHIEEREARKSLDLLRFALLKSGVDQRAWQLAPTFDALQPCDDCLCLYGGDERWTVAYTERGLWRELGQFPEAYEATLFFYAKFHSGPTPHDALEAWEAETGQQFSMTD